MRKTPARFHLEELINRILIEEINTSPSIRQNIIDRILLSLFDSDNVIVAQAYLDQRVNDGLPDAPDADIRWR